LKVIIIGAGIAGALARGYFASFAPQVYEAKATPEKTHKAIMRFRDMSIGYALGISLEKVEIHKAIYYQGNFVNLSPMVSNLYSKKVSQGIFSRSIQSIEPVERYLAKDDYTIPSVNYSKNLERVEPNKCFFADGTAVEYDFCISTIPITVMAKAAGIQLDVTKAKNFPICVARYPVKCKSDVFQTIYFPDLNMPTYRVSLERQTLIVEALGEQKPNLDDGEVLKAFGMQAADLGEPECGIQPMGKIVEMDDAKRRQVIVELTEKFNIYSLGRYATWRNITADVLLKDLEIISKMVNLSSFSKKYALRLEESK
jgi:hypothetical protein